MTLCTRRTSRSATQRRAGVPRFLALWRAIAAWAGIAALAGCAPRNEDTIQIATTKAGLFLLPMEYRALHARLEQTLDRPIRFIVQPNGAAIGQQLAQGNAHYAILSCQEFLDIEDPGGCQLLATAVNANGSTVRKALIIGRASGPVSTIADCKGKRFAFGARNDLLTDVAVRRALQEGGLPPKELLTELLPPPFAFDGRLYLRDDVPAKVMADLTVPAGVIDEVQFRALKESGGNLILGPSRDQFKIIGETRAIPETTFVAGPKADPAVTEKLTDFLLNRVKTDPDICAQMGVVGFAPADPAIYESVRRWLAASPGD